MAIVLWIRQRIHSLSSHLLITYVTVMLIGLGSVIVWTGRQLAAQDVEQAQDQLQLQAQIIANALREPVERPDEASLNPPTRSIPVLLSSYAQNIGGRVTLVDPQLNVVASSDPQVPLRSIGNYPEFSSAGQDIRRDPLTNEERLFVAAPVPADRSRALGFVQLSVPMAPIYAAISQTWLNLLSIGAVALFVTILASLLLARRIAVPVQRLTATSEQISSGRLDERVSPAGPSEVRRLGHAFNQMADRVQEMVAQQREFVDNAAHELRSPLTSLRLRLDMLQAHGANNPELTRQYLGQMQRDVGYLQRLVDHLLNLASVEEGEPAAMVPTDFAPLLHEVVGEMAPLVQQAQLDLKVEVPAHLPAVEANADQIRMVVRNLIDNAIKYTRAGGTITLAAQANGQCIQIRVADNGMGIPAEALPHVFDRFYRVDRARSRKQGGAGLGLALARAMVEASHGTIAVESRVHEGSQFTVQLPLAK